MPTVTNPASANDSWEALLPDSRKLTGLSSKRSSGSLSQLTHLLWPSIPTKTADTLARKFPKVIVNPQSGSCPAAADPSIALDDAAIQTVAPFWQVDDEPEVSTIPVVECANYSSQSQQRTDTALFNATLTYTTHSQGERRCILLPVG